jgi:TonB family protein
MRKTALTFISLLLCAVCAFADRAADWRRDQTAIEALLQQKRYAEARKASIKLTNHMLDHMDVNDEARKLFARTVALRAAAEDGLGNADDTNWYRLVAEALDPQVAMPTMTTPPSGPIAIVLPEEVTEKPELKRRRDPVRPGSVRGGATAVVRVVIDVDGVVRQPSIISSGIPAASYAALEAVKQWHFRPARKDGKAVAMPFNLTIAMH